MGFYDELDRQTGADQQNDKLGDAIDMFVEKFGVAPLIPVEASFTYEKLINALKKAVECGEPGAFKE